MILSGSLPFSGPQFPHVGGFSRSGYSERAGPWKEGNGVGEWKSKGVGSVEGWE